MESQGGKIAQAVKDVNFDAGLEIASPEMIRQHIESSVDRHRMREIITDMHDNRFFKEYIIKYQKGLTRAL